MLPFFVPRSRGEYLWNIFIYIDTEDAKTSYKKLAPLVVSRKGRKRNITVYPSEFFYFGASVNAVYTGVTRREHCAGSRIGEPGIPLLPSCGNLHEPLNLSEALFLHERGIIIWRYHLV